MFQDDIFPPCFSGTAALSAEEWASGVDKDPRLVAFSASGLSDVGAKEGQKVVDACHLGPLESLHLFVFCLACSCSVSATTSCQEGRASEGGEREAGVEAVVLT